MLTIAGKQSVDRSAFDAMSDKMEQARHVARLLEDDLKSVRKVIDTQSEQLDETGFAGSESYMRFLKDNLAFERDAWKDLARDREQDERDRARAARQASEEAARDWKQKSESIERSLTDALLRGFEGGKDVATNFVDTLKNMFKTLVLEPTIKYFLQPVTGAAMGALGALGVPGYANASGSLGGVGNLFSSGASLAGGASSWLTGASFALADSLAYGGSAAGLIAADTAVFGAAGGASTAAALGATGTSTALGAMSALSAAAPYIAAAVALYSVLASKGGGPKQEIRGGAQLFDTPGRYGVDQGLQSLVDSFYAQYSSTVTGLGGTPRGDISAMLRLARDPAGDAGTQFLAGLGGGANYRFYSDSVGRDSAEEQKAISEQMTRMLVSALKATDLNDIADKLLSGLDPATASAEQLAAALNAAQAQMQAMEEQTRAMATAANDVLKKMMSDARETMMSWADVARSVIGTRIDIAGGELSALDPQEKLSLAQKGFADVSRRAALGDMSAFEGLGSSAQEYLGAARGYYASGPGYASIYEEVQAGLERAQNLAVRQTSLMSGGGWTKPLYEETKTGNAATEAGIEAMIKQLQEIKGVLREIESGNALANSAPRSASGSGTTSLGVFQQLVRQL